MGISPDLKQWILRRYGDTAILPPEATATSNCGATVMISDTMYKIKPDVTKPFCNNKRTQRNTYTCMETGADWVNRWLLLEVKQFYARGGKVVYLCFDRAPPLNKQETHDLRYSNLPPAPLDPAELGKLDRLTLPPDWSTYVNDYRTVPELLHFVARSLIYADDPRQCVFTPPVGGQLYLHGVYWDARRPDWTYDRHKPPKRPDPYVHFVENAPIHSESGVVGHRRVTGTDVRRFSTHEIDNLAEGEVACLYFSRHHPTEDQLVVSVDGDVLLMLLLHSQDRKDPVTGHFRNRIFLRLVVSGQTPNLTIDINKLFTAMTEDATLLHAGVANRVLTLCAIGIMIQNDFVRNYCQGIGKWRPPTEKQLQRRSMHSQASIIPPAGACRILQNNKKLGGVLAAVTPIECPWLLITFFQHANEFATMIQADKHLDGSTREGSLDQPVDVNINEELFELYTKQCYVSKYSKAAKSVSINAVRCYLMRGRRKHHRVMVARDCRRYVRQLLWTLLYWLNGPRNGCNIPSPVALYRNLPYYGWEMDRHTLRCRSAYRVSIKRTVDATLDLDALGRPRWRGDGLYKPPAIYHRGHTNTYTAEIARYERRAYLAAYIARRNERGAQFSIPRAHLQVRKDTVADTNNAINPATLYFDSYTVLVAAP